MSRLTEEHVAALGSMSRELSDQGIALDYEEEGEFLRVSLSATSEGCADCLVPPTVMKAMIVEMVGHEYQGDAILLQYPSDAAHFQTPPTAMPQEGTTVQ